MNSLSSSNQPLVIAALKNQDWWVEAAVVVGGSALMAISSITSFPLPGGVPITAQVYAVLLLGALLGARRSLAALVLWLGEGMVNLPVYALGHSAWTPSTVPGVPTIFGTTAGYLFAFPIAAFLVGWLADRGWDRRIRTSLVAMLLGLVIIYVGGAGWLSHFIGLNLAFHFGVLPFIGLDLTKAALAALTLPAGWAILRKVRP